MARFARRHPKWALAVLLLLVAAPFVYAGTGFSSGQGAGITGSSPSLADPVMDSITLDRTNQDLVISEPATGTLQLQAGSGDGGVVLQLDEDGAGAGTPALILKDSANTSVIEGFMIASTLRLYAAGSSTTIDSNLGADLAFKSTGVIKWTDSATSAVGGSLDLGIDRLSAGIAEITDGSSGAGSLLVAGEIQQGDTAGTAQWHEVAGEVALTDETATAVWQLALAQEAGAGGTVSISIYATDGTDMQIHAEDVTWAAVNKAGTITSEIATATTLDADADSVGTLTATFTITEPSADVIQFNVNANTSLTPSTFRVRFKVGCDTTGVTPQ